MPPQASPLDSPEIDQIWIDAARSLGLAVVRSGDAYAATDGRGTLVVGTRDSLDGDDCLAQLVFHELCHALVQGDAAWGQADWGLDNTTTRDDVRELACLRLQAHLAGEHGLRAPMTPTTDWKAYYRALPDAALEPMSGAAADVAQEAEACALARDGLARARRPAFAGVLDGALARTAALVVHAVGFPLGPAGETCGSCGWLYRGGRGTAVDRCRQTAPETGDGQRVDPQMRACARWEPAIDCLDCGACCREAYHSVSVSMRDPMVWKQPAFVVRSGHRWSVLRSGDKCACLDVAPAAAGARYGCSIYEDRPQTCRDFERGGRHCLTARRRVGLSR